MIFVKEIQPKSLGRDYKPSSILTTPAAPSSRQRAIALLLKCRCIVIVATSQQQPYYRI